MRILNDTYCVVCGEYCVEGRQICPKCERKSYEYCDINSMLGEKNDITKIRYNGRRVFD